MDFLGFLSMADQTKVQKICRLLGENIDVTDVQECDNCYNALIGGTQYRKCGILLYALYTISKLGSTEKIRNEAKIRFGKNLKLETEQGVI